MDPLVILKLHSLARSIRLPPPSSVARVFADDRGFVPASNEELWSFVKAAYPMPDFDGVVRGCADFICDALPIARDERERAHGLAVMILDTAFADWWNAIQSKQFALLRELHPGVPNGPCNG